MNRWTGRWPRPTLAQALAGATIALVIMLAVLDGLTRPARLPDFEQVKAGWTPSEAWLEDRNGALIDSVRVDYQARRLDWTPLEQVAPTVRDAIVAVEDRRFALHDGIDWMALGGALRDRLSGGTRRGASTLAMQLAGYLEPESARPGSRGLIDKLRQLRAGEAIGDKWTRDQIMEAYLNLASFRGETQGIGAAALSLFGKTPAALGKDEAWLLAALLANPQAEPMQLAARACRLGRYTAADCSRLTALTAGTLLNPARNLALDPALAPHLAVRLLTKPGLRLRSTVDRDVQRLAAQALSRELQGLGPDKARDGAVLVVDNASGDVLAYVGGVAGTGSRAGAVDGTRAYRQAGSTLKPWLFALALEKRYLTPASILADTPVALDTASGLYVPQDYDRDFKGPVSVRTALGGSLNVPAVRALLLVGVDAFRDRLWDLGYQGLTEEGGYYGFSLALGSAEVTLLEQVNAYRTLANGGLWSPLRLTMADLRPAPRPLLSPQAAWLTGDMMADGNARAATFGFASALHLPFWAAVKTGTSKGMRDNWCIGYTPRFTVGVWVGNAEGDAMQVHSGTSGAAPVWRDVMQALAQRAPSSAPARPPGLEARRIRFADGIEQPRTEYFMAGTGTDLVQGAPAEARRARIASPVSGSIFARDPDIPAERQQLVVNVSGSARGQRLLLNGKPLTRTTIPLAALNPGAHRLRLIDARGNRLDEVLFTVR
jgi:penicillin-binding protein 1C